MLDRSIRNKEETLVRNYLIFLELFAESENQSEKQIELVLLKHDLMDFKD